MNKEYVEFYVYLINNHVGEDNAIHSKDLEKKFNICPRTVRTYISNLRKSGIPVCSNETGYWIAATPEEACKTVDRLGDLASEINNARNGIAFGAIQMLSVAKVTEENIHISIEVG